MAIGLEAMVKLYGGNSWRWCEAAHLPARRTQPALFVIGAGDDPFATFGNSVELETLFKVFSSSIRVHTFLLVIENAERAARWLRERGRALPSNVFLGARIEAQADIERVLLPTLAIPAARHVAVLDPLASPLDLPAELLGGARHGSGRVGWVVIGCNAKRARGRMLRTDHIGNVIHDCAEAGVPVWVENLGRSVVDHTSTCTTCGEDFLAHELRDEFFPDAAPPHAFVGDNVLRFTDEGGARPFEWPEHLRVQARPAWITRQP
jgi:protein gp37